MRYVLLLVTAASLAGCVMDPASRYDPHVPPQSSTLETINPYKVDHIPDTAYEVWKRDQERNKKVARVEDKDAYPPLFKGQKADFSGGAK